MSKLGFPGATPAGSTAADYAFGANSMIPGTMNIQTRFPDRFNVPVGRGSVPMGNATTRDIVPPGRITNLPARPMVPPTRREQRASDVLAAVGRITNLPARPMMPRPQPLAPVQNIGLPQGELPIALPDMSVQDFAALRERAMQDYFNQLAGLGL